jgi:type IV pilus assembly protein PilC
MTAYAYFCLDARGAETRGRMDAPDEIAARRQLRERGLKILSLAEGTGDGGGGGLLAGIKRVARWISRFRSIGDGDRAMFFRQMHLMLNAGHTLLEALSAAALFTSKARLSDTLERIADGIRRGSSLSAACGGEKELVNRLAQKMIGAGEATGELGAVFDRLADLIERRREVRIQLFNALLYPLIVLVITLFVAWFMVAIVMPRFRVFLSSRGSSLPWEAQTLLAVTDWLAEWGGVIAFAVFAFIIGVPLLRRVPKAKRVIDALALRLPIIGKTVLMATMTQVTWIFGVLIKSRLTVLESLRICKELAGNASFSGALAQAEEDVLAGKSLAVAFERPVLPALLRHMAAVGERSGQLDTVMEALGTHYRKALDARVKFLSALVEPVLILACGSLVCVVYYVFFVTLFTVAKGG